MSKTIHILLLVLVFPMAMKAQLSTNDVKLLRTELAKKINDLRVSKGVSPLVFNDTLKKAADLHSEYMVTNNILTHDENIAKYADPKKRVTESGGRNFEYVGENVLHSSTQDFPLNKKEILALAEEMFLIWKNSPGHYANMIDPEFGYGDLGFKVDTKNNLVYATQVFGKKGVVIKSTLSNNGFNLQMSNENCDDEFNSFSNVVLNMGNSLSIQNNNIKYYYHNINYFNKIIKNPNDGIAVDVIAREQVQCGQPNKLDVSEVYDGALLQPTYRDELNQNNEAKSDYRIISKIGELPSELQNKEISISFLLIKDGKMCKYMVPSYIPHKDYKLREIEPITHNPTEVHLLHAGIIESQEVFYDFKTGISIPVKLPTIENSNYKIHSVDINSYSSVEGDSINNTTLFNNRAAKIKKHVQSKIRIHDSLIKIDAKENWSLMDFQFQYFFRDDLTGLSRDSLRSIFKTRDSTLNWDSLFYAQRKATATLHYYGEYPPEEENSKITELNLRTAVLTGNVDLANKALYVMNEESNFDSEILFEKSILEFFKKEAKGVTNYSALLSKVFDRDIDKSTEFLSNWINKEKELDEDSKYNLTHLYTLVGIHLLDEWDLASYRLSNVVHPKKVNVFAKNITKSELILNLHLTYIQYSGQINDGPGMSKSFNFIVNYFKNNSLSKEDDVDLTLFYNNWSMYHMTIDHLLPKFDKNEINEDGVFVLAQTLNFSNEERYVKQFEKVNQKAAELNAEKWCKWINTDFQILRNQMIKRMYCEICD